MNLVFLGPPGSGKGTQAARLSQKFGLVHLSTGDMLRNEIKNGTPIGAKAEAFMKHGELVHDDLLISMIEDKINCGALSSGFILDGFPRTIPQAESLDLILLKHSLKLDKAILFDVPDAEIIKRLSGRWYCPTCQTGYNYPAQVSKVSGICDKDGTQLTRRHDDEESVVTNRLEVYRKQTKPIVDYYRLKSVLHGINADQSPNEVFDDLLTAVSERAVL
jgi:adenylate kinase